MATFSEIDFGFRYGTKNAVDFAGYKNGTLDFTTDTAEMIVNIGGQRISTKSVYIYQSEDEIRSIASPERGKLYFATDTLNLLTFDYTYLQWTIIGGTNVSVELAEIRQLITNIRQFNIVILNYGESFPGVGESGTIYFVPREPIEVDEDTLFDEYIWVDSYGYYEKIGMTTADLGNYYTKVEVNNLIAALNNTMSNIDIRFSNNEEAISDLNNTVSELDERLGADESAMSSMGTALNNTQNRVTYNSNMISNIQNQVIQITENAEINTNDISSLTESVTANISSLQSTISTNSSNIGSLQRTTNSLNNSISNINSDISSINDTIGNLDPTVANYKTVAERLENLEDRISNIESRLSTIESSMSTMQTNISNIQNAITNGFDVDYGNEG